MDDKKNDVSADVANGDDKVETVFKTQSDFDKAIAREQKRIAEKYADYDNVKQRLQTLEDEAKAKMQAEMTEVEKKNAALKELEDKLNNINLENKKLKLSQIKIDVLNEAKYAVLPRAYKALVEANEDVEAVKKNADEILAEFEKDTGHKKDFGRPLKSGDTSNGGGKKIFQTAKEMADAIRGNINRR